MTTNAQAPAKLYYEDVQVGDELPRLVKGPVTHLQLVRYAGASGDFNPLHTDPKIGEALGIGGILAIELCRGLGVGCHMYLLHVVALFMIAR